MALVSTPTDQLGALAPDFNLPATNGQKYSMSDFAQGRPFVVMFICNHCPYVKAIEDRLIALGQDLKKLNVPIVAISSNDAKNYPEDSFDSMKKRAEEKQYPFPYLYDDSQAVAKLFGAVCTPDFFVYNRKSQLSYRGRLDDSWKDQTKVTQRELYQAIQQLLISDEFSKEQTPSMGCSIKWK